MADSLTYDSIEVGAPHGPYYYPLTDRIEAYLSATQNEHPWHFGRSPWGPPVAPPTIIANAALRFIDWIAPAPGGTLHARQAIDTAAALRLDRQPIGYGKFTEKFEKRGRRWCTFEVRWREETGLLIGHTRTTLALAEAAQTPDASSESSARQDTARSGELTPVIREISQANVDALSADAATAAQSIQTNIDVAKAAGYPATVAPGMMTADYISQLMTEAFGKEWFEYANLTLSFIKPVFTGDDVTANGSVASAVQEGAIVRKTYDVWATNQPGDVLAVGSASSLVRRHPA